MPTAIGLVCLLAVAGAVAYGAILVGACIGEWCVVAGRWLREFCRDLRGAVEDDPARDCARDSEEDMP